MDKPFSYEEFKDIYSKVPRLCVDIIARTQNGIVLVLRGPGYGWENLWHLPGGGLLYKEKVTDALHRILKNEIGAEANIVKPFSYIEFPSEEKERGFGYSVSLVFLCDLLPGQLQSHAEELREVKVFSELPENMVIEHKIFLENHWDEMFKNETDR